MPVIIQVVTLLLCVNFFPPLADLIWGNRYRYPVDGGRLWFDRRPIFGSHKTIRGILVSLPGGAAVFLLSGLPWWVGAVAALLAMAGDLLSSFIKRRLNIASGKAIVFLDQLFECLFPVLFLARVLPLGAGQALMILLCFIPIAHCGSLFWNYILYRPPLDGYPRLIHSTVRLREWRSCHVPLARWQALCNLTSFLSNQLFLTSFFKITGLYEKGVRNTLDIRLEEKTFRFASLPQRFDHFRLLLLTDLHLDGLAGLTDELIRRLTNIEVDLCLVGGDIRMQTYGPIAPCMRQLRRLLPHIRSRHGALGILGNHDCIEMTPDFEEAGLIMLINDSWRIDKGEERIWLVGVDDPHYYKTHNAEQAFRDVRAEDFTIFLAHSPEAYQTAAEHGADLYLCGHTHGGQICLPDGKPVLTNSRAPRFTAAGNWQYRGMTGYTSRGAGASSVPLRFHCPGEITLITLRRGMEGE
ncbi:MAG: CDP-archaeol synthase [Deltaproteobacteria bacterium]|nr:CDP-archaeol synthase [Deltaproteobacteria bacterium]